MIDMLISGVRSYPGFWDNQHADNKPNKKQKDGYSQETGDSFSVLLEQEMKKLEERK